MIRDHAPVGSMAVTDEAHQLWPLGGCLEACGAGELRRCVRSGTVEGVDTAVTAAPVVVPALI